MLPDDIKAELNQIKDAYRSGVMQRARRPVAVTISRHLRERGISTVGPEGVENWLTRD